MIKNLDPEQCKNLKKFYPDPRKFDLLKRKGAFYSRLNDEEITNEDYEHAKTVWKEFRKKR